MTAIHELQHEFAKALNQQHHDAGRHLKGHRFAPEDLLKIYQNNFVISLSESLAASFPMTRRLVGETFFDQAARRFVLSQPMIDANVLGYGAGFPQLLGELAAPFELPYITDLAQLEWCYAEVANLAGYQQAFPFEQLQQLDESQQSRLIFELNHSARLLHSPYPVFSIYQMVLAEQVDPIELDRPQSGVLWRISPTDTRMMLLSPQQTEVIQRLFRRENLSELLKHPTLEPMEHIQHWIGLKLITHYSLANIT